MQKSPEDPGVQHPVFKKQLNVVYLHVVLVTKRCLVKHPPCSPCGQGDRALVTGGALQALGELGLEVSPPGFIWVPPRDHCGG